MIDAKTKGMVLFLTFMSYMLFHAARKPPSVVKSVLRGGEKGMGKAGRQGWSPFNGKTGDVMLGNVDLAFLLAYAIGMFFSGRIADSVNLKVFLTIGMLGTGLFTFLIGMAYVWEIHSYSYFIVMQIVAGAFQSTGWPSVVAIMGNWFTGKRGLIMGIWNAHTSTGNILGAVVAAAVLSPPWGWGWSFIIPGWMMIIGAAIVYTFLVPSPERDEDHNRIQLVHLRSAARLDTPEYRENIEDGESFMKKPTEKQKPVGIVMALRIPGVLAYSFCLFFCKLVAYTFLYWLPFFISQESIGGRHLSPSESARVSVMFDIGGVFGGILAGYISDHLQARGLVSAAFLYGSILMLYLYKTFGTISLAINLFLMTLSGALVNGPYALITTAVSADLGTHESVHGSARALATVTAIIDGMGSLGACVGPSLTGYLAAYGWDAVFYMLYLSAFTAAVLLTGLVFADLRAIQDRKEVSTRIPNMASARDGEDLETRSLLGVDAD